MDCCAPASSRPIRELRELTRYRKRLIQERVSKIERVHKLL
jgi:hypothetical protein